MSIWQTLLGVLPNVLFQALCCSQEWSHDCEFLFWIICHMNRIVLESFQLIFASLLKGTAVLSPSLLFLFEYNYDDWCCSKHFVTMREKPREFKKYKTQIVEASLIPVVSHFPISYYMGGKYQHLFKPLQSCYLSLTGKCNSPS